MIKTNILSSNLFKGYTLSITAGILAALFYIPYKKALLTVSPETFVMAVYFAAFGFNFLGGMMRRDSFKINSPSVIAAVLFAIFSIIGNYASGASMQWMSVSITVVTIRVQILLVMFLGWLLLKEYVSSFFWIGAMLTLVGILLMSYSEEGWQIRQISGILWGLTAATCFASIQVTMKYFIHQMYPITMNLLRLFIGFLIVAFLPGRWESFLSLSWEEWQLAIVSALFGPTLSRLCHIYSVRYIPVSQSALFTMLTPVFALFFSWLLLDNLPTMREILGGSIILIGVSAPVLTIIHQHGKSSSKK